MTSPARALIDTLSMGCKSCALSRWSGQKQTLWCEWHDKPAKYKCGQFCYEPGTDEGGRTR